MMMFVLGILVFLGFYLSLHMYLTFNVFWPKLPAVSVALIFFLLTQMLWGNYVLQRVLGWDIPKWVFTAGFLMAAFSLCLLFMYMASDVSKLIGLYPKPLAASRTLECAVFSGFAVVITVLGYFNVACIRERELVLESDKKGDDLKIVFFSDTHIGGAAMNPKRFEKWVKKINAFEPDLVLVGGDIVDGSVDPFIEDGYTDLFKKLDAKQGTFAVLGNHEYYGGGLTHAISAFRKAGMTILRDEKIYLHDLGVTLIGRDDTMMGGMGRHAFRKTQSLTHLNEGVDPESYVIVMTHNPIRFDEAARINADLQLSGHTHAGQLFPATLIIKFIYEKPYGLLKKGKSLLYTTSGMGAWGPPIRFMSRSEVVFLTVKRRH